MTYQNKLIGSMFLIIVVGLIAIPIVQKIYEKYAMSQKKYATSQLVNAEADFLSLNPDVKLYEQDVWGAKLIYETKVDEYSITAKVTSPGPDGKLNTSDDIIGKATNHNTTKAIGSWIGSTTKEAVSGLWDGLKSKSQFKKEEK